MLSLKNVPLLFKFKVESHDTILLIVFCRCANETLLLVLRAQIVKQVCEVEGVDFLGIPLTASQEQDFNENLLVQFFYLLDKMPDFKSSLLGKEVLYLLLCEELKDMMSFELLVPYK